MNANFFLDTNVLIYSFDDNQPEKKKRALTLIAEAIQTGQGMISWQVIQEFLSVSTRKFSPPLKNEDTQLYLQKILKPLCRVFPDLNLYSEALDVLAKTRYTFYDSLIVASAIRGECTILFSEDLQHNHQIGSLKIQNPFL